MGNFYANIVIPDSDVGRVASAVDELGRRAYVATDGKATVVLDERCDKQDLDELQRLARELSKKLGGVALATCNHDDDVLWYALASNGGIVDTYESNPGYFEGGPDTPKGGDAALLCDAFDAAGKESDVDALLRRAPQDFAFEVDRHRELLELLGLPVEIALLGFGYVSEGELTRGGKPITIRALGGAVAPSEVDEDAPFVPPPIDPQLQAAMQAEAADLMVYGAALAFSRVDVPARFALVLGNGSANGYALLMRLQRYIISHQLGYPTGVIRADDMLAEMLGVREFPFLALSRLVVRAFGVPPLTSDEAAAFRTGDAKLHLRFHEALRDAASELT
jgi:hypothetical protein